MVVTEIRRFMDAAIGKLSPAKARELATSLVQGQGKEQVTRAAQDLLEWSNKNRERLVELVRSEVRSQLKQLGVASRDEVDALRRRVRELERGGAPRARSTAKRSTAKRSTAKRSTAKRSTAKRSTAKRPTAKRPTAKRPASTVPAATGATSPRPATSVSSPAGVPTGS
jgi:polyhydroxyalkanoate synthesis regulator phasin